MRRDMTVQTEVALQKIRIVSDLGAHVKAARVRFEKKLDMDTKGQKVGFGYFCLQCERSLSELFHFNSVS